MALETEHAFAPYALPSSNDSPYRVPSLGLSRQSSRHGSPAISSSPPSIPPRGDIYYPESKEKDVTQDESISILDPRRFTPTLHASLVSEILSLRREVESKNGVVLSLEETIAANKGEHDKLTEATLAQEKENRSLKRQVEKLEGGTLTALEEIAKERDQANESLSEMRKRLDLSQKKVRTQEEEADRTHSLWDGDRARWDVERRKLDRKVHVAETRLKALLAEVEAARINGQLQIGIDDDNSGHQNEDSLRNNKRSESAMSHRTNDGVDARNVRFSHGVRGSMFNGVSLAEELEFDDEGDAQESDLDEGELPSGAVSPGALPEESMQDPRPFSAQSHRSLSKARKLLGLSVEEEVSNLSAEGRLSEELDEDILDAYSSPAVQYTSTATQFSPPPSPKLEPQQSRSDVDSSGEATVTGVQASMHRASTKSIITVSSASQTIEHPPSPPDSPVIDNANAFEKGLPSESVEMRVASTQTEELDAKRSSIPTYLEESIMNSAIPVITIHPPVSSNGTERHNVVLPPRTRSAGCQVAIRPRAVRSISVQTEVVRIDNRPVKLPAHLLPSAISSKPSSPSPEARSTRDHLPIMHPPRRAAPKPPTSAPASTYLINSSNKPRDSYPGNNDNGPLNNISGNDIRRPIRTDSLFAGFDTLDDDAEFSDDDSFVTREPIRKTLSKVKNSWTLVPQTAESLDNRLESTMEEATPSLSFEESIDQELSQKNIDPRFWREKKEEKPLTMSTLNNKEPNMRRAALISSGAAAHAQRPLSPGLSESSSLQAKDPPFPVPTRASSRKLPISSSDGAVSPTPHSTSFFSNHLRKEHGRPPSKKPVLRKIRSAAASTKPSHNEVYPKRIRSPPPPTSSSSIPESPHLLPPPPMPTENGQPLRDFHPDGHRHQPSTVSETANEQTSVVDAIAQTMIGEWMWKYVRRRKSFGITESPAAEFESGRNGSESGTVNGIRHKRWVWLAPYERAVMWSSKQPTSGSALMGKNGRKLAIQSVLDVKDDTPMPKGENGPIVGRSILILTPQRALKFTAMSMERHYVWLAALSFLSHSSLGVDDLVSLPPVPPKETHLLVGARNPPTASLRRNPIRDSIRIAKDKSRPETASRKAFVPALPTGVVNEYSSHFSLEEEGAAEAPHVPRFASHSRQRSNTGPRPLPPSSFRSFSSTIKPSSITATSSDTYTRTSSVADRSVAGSQHGSFPRRSGRKEEVLRDDKHAHSGIATENFFDAVGTVRMEAFVERGKGGYAEERAARFPILWGNGEPGAPLATRDRDRDREREKERERERRRGGGRTKEGKKRDIGYWGVMSGSETGGRGSRDPFADF